MELPVFIKYPIGIQNFKKIYTEDYLHAALQQIEDNGYASPFASDYRKKI